MITAPPPPPLPIINKIEVVNQTSVKTINNTSMQRTTKIVNTQNPYVETTFNTKNYSIGSNSRHKQKMKCKQYC
jgi:hypothetical protein